MRRGTSTVNLSGVDIYTLHSRVKSLPCQFYWFVGVNVVKLGELLFSKHGRVTTMPFSRRTSYSSESPSPNFTMYAAANGSISCHRWNLTSQIYENEPELLWTCHHKNHSVGELHTAPSRCRQFLQMWGASGVRSHVCSWELGLLNWPTN